MNHYIVIKVKEFIKQAWPALLLFFVGDIATTIWAMENGAMECNPVLAGLMDDYGYGALMIMKAIGILFLVGIYIYKHISKDKYKINHWNNVVKIFTLAGFILVVNNLYVISTLI